MWQCLRRDATERFQLLLIIGTLFLHEVVLK